MRVAYLGPGGTYSQEAAIQKLGVIHQPVFCNSLDAVVAAVISGNADYSVLPIENSTNGVVQAALNAFVASALEGKVQIIDEVAVLVRHQLYSRATDLNQIKVVYSHPQVWGQTNKWLEKNLPNAQRINSSSSAQGVQIALNDQSCTIAALGGPLTSDEQPLIPVCSDDVENTTRFLILAKPGTLAGLGYDATEKVVYAVKEHTRIEDLLKTFNGINGTIKFMGAAPSSKPWVYHHYVEICGGDCKQIEDAGFLITGYRPSTV